MFHFYEASGSPTAAEFINKNAADIARMVRGETLPLSAEEQKETLQSSISYDPTGLAVIGWNAALIYDAPSGAQTAIQLLAYANSQLLELRDRDELLTRGFGRRLWFSAGAAKTIRPLENGRRRRIGCSR